MRVSARMMVCMALEPETVDECSICDSELAKVKFEIWPSTNCWNCLEPLNIYFCHRCLSLLIELLGIIQEIQENLNSETKRKTAKGNK